MFSGFKILFQALFGTAIARLLTGAGLAVVSGAALIPLVLSSLNAASSAIGGLGGDVLALVAISGLGEFLSAVGSALLTRAAINSARVGLKVAAS